jgi:hypothetical protein
MLGRALYLMLSWLLKKNALSAPYTRSIPKFGGKIKGKMLVFGLYIRF